MEKNAKTFYRSFLGKSFVKHIERLSENLVIYCIKFQRRVVSVLYSLSKPP
jgi:hypothetical protein